MFRNVKRKLAGVLTYDSLLEKSVANLKASFDTEGASEDLALTQLKNNAEWYKTWLEYHSSYMKDVADADNRGEQIINLRKAIVTQVEASISAQPLLKDEVSEEDKRLLAKKLNPDLTYEELVGLKCQSYVFAQTSIRCMRVISKELGDARENDWFAMYCDLYSQFVDHIYKSMVAQEKEIVYVLEPLLGPLKQWVEETKKKLLEGYNWDYDKEKIQEERRIEEEKEAERKAKEPSKQKTISNHQIDE